MVLRHRPGRRQSGKRAHRSGTAQSTAFPNWSVVFALDARTGKERWRWDPGSEPDGGVPNLLRSGESRPGHLHQNLIIAPIIDGRLEALDAETGKVVWESRVAYPQDNYTIAWRRRIAKGKVIVVSGSEYPVRGFFSAFDAANWAFCLEILYRSWRSVQAVRKRGHEEGCPETWSPEAWKMGGGGSVWDGIAYDPERIWFTSAPATQDRGPNSCANPRARIIYACSVVAVRPDTGELIIGC